MIGFIVSHDNQQGFPFELNYYGQYYLFTQNYNVAEIADIQLGTVDE